MGSLICSIVWGIGCRPKILPPKREGEAKEEGAEDGAAAGGEEVAPQLEDADGEEDMAVEGEDGDTQSVEDADEAEGGSDE